MSNQDVFPILVIDDFLGVGSMGCLMTWLSEGLVVSPDQISQREKKKVIINLEDQNQMSLIITKCDSLNLSCSFLPEHPQEQP